MPFCYSSVFGPNIRHIACALTHAQSPPVATPASHDASHDISSHRLRMIHTMIHTHFTAPPPSQLGAPLRHTKRAAGCQPPPAIPPTRETQTHPRSSRVLPPSRGMRTPETLSPLSRRHDCRRYLAATRLVHRPDFQAAPCWTEQPSRPKCTAIAVPLARFGQVLQVDAAPA